MNGPPPPAALDATPARATRGAGLAYRREGWDAHLTLRFAAVGARTVLVGRSHSGPLVVQKALYPEGEAICHAIVVHPPGGVAGGDRLHLETVLNGAAQVLLTTPGAGKWYKANGAEASQTLTFTVNDNAALEWLPQETILFDAADVRLDTQVRLAPAARYAGWEITCLGRQASGERFATGRLRQRLQLWRGERPIWGEFGAVRGGDPLLQSPVGMNGRAVTATFVVAAGATPPAVLEACRACTPDDDGGYAVTALPEVFAARYLGDSAQSARRYFEALWQILRPWYAGVAMQRPRIWST